MTFLKGLVCSECGKAYPELSVQTFCQSCESPLLAQYDLESIRNTIDRDEFSLRQPGLWRWKELLPIRDHSYQTTLGEGDTPLLRLSRIEALLNLPELFIKEEGRNPTGSFKARGLSVAVSKARELGIHHLVIPSAGNAGGALAAYAARSGLSSTVVMPEDTPRANIDECRCAGAEVILVTGLITDCGKLAQELAEKDGVLSLATFREPYRLEGKKTIGFELAESFNWELPEVIIFPTGGGTGLVGMWKAFQELKELGWLEKSTMPRMVAVQSSGCAPIVEAFRSGKSNCVFWPHAQTIATGLKVPLSFADKIILRVIHESNGEAVAVEDESIRKAQLNLVKEEGIHASPEGAATLAGLIRVISAKDDARNGRIVIFNTASGLKYLG